MDLVRLSRGAYSRVAILLMASMAAFAPLSSGQLAADAATLDGTVRDSDNHPVAGATVSLLPKSGTQGFTATTDAKGSYRFSALPVGSYSVSAKMTGFGDAPAVAVGLKKEEAKTLDLALRTLKPSESRTQASAAKFFDEPTFTVAGVTDATNLGGHGSNTTQPTKEALTRETISLSRKSPAHSPTSPALEKSLRDAAEREPRNFDANHELGAMLVADGRAREAFLYLERAEQLKPGNYDNSYQLAVACAQTGNYDRARITVQTLLAIEDKPELHNLLADIEERAGNPLVAVREYQRAAEMNPTEAYLFDWGAELLAHRALEPAIEVFTRGNRLFAGSSRMMIGLGVASYARGDVDAATQRLCAAADLDSNNPTPYLFLGRIQNVETARSDAVSGRLERFARLHPDNAFANYYYAVSLWKARQTPEDAAGLEQVESLLQKALRLDPKLSPAYLQLGILYAERKNFPKAIDAYQKAIETDPSSEGAHYRLAQIYRQIGERDKARSEIQLYERISQERAKDAERERHEMQQFVYTLRDHAQASPQ